MLRKISLATGLIAGLLAIPAHAAGDAAAGMADMSKWNLVVLGNWDAGHDVEGRAIVVGNISGSSATVGIGRTTAGQSATPTTDPTLVVGGNNLVGNLNINNGSNGGNGTVATGPSLIVRGNSNSGGGINLNSPGPRSLVIGGNFNGNANNVDVTMIGGNMTGGNLNPVSTGSVQLGGQKTGGTMNLNGASFQQNLGAAFKTGIESAVDGMTSDLSDDLHAFSSTLSGFTLPSNPSFLSTANGGQTLVLNAVKGGNGFSLFNLTQADLTGFSSIAYNFVPDSGPVVINFTGKTLLNGKVEATLGLNFVTVTDDFKAVNQSVIWNFGTADFVKFNTEFYGSVLAPDAEVNNVNAINGSVAANSFKQGGEVHLGTFDSFDLPPPPAVPEPASWAMMILGFGAVGAARRRRASVLRFA